MIVPEYIFLPDNRNGNPERRPLAIAATFMATELAWAVFGNYILKMVDADSAEAAGVGAAIARASRLFLDKPDLLT
jgi:hypothetical protein